MCIRHRKMDYFKQILIVLLPAVAFFTAASLDKLKEFDLFRSQIIVVLLFDLFYFLGCIYLLGKNGVIQYLKRDILFLKIRENCWLIFVLVYTVGIRLVQFSDLQRWDSAIYYGQMISGCNNFNFTLSSFLKGFGAASHFTWGYLGILAIGEFLNTGKYIGMYIVTLVLTLICIYCVFRILQSILPQRSEKYIAISTCLISSLPLFAGTFSYCNPDMGVALFSVMMIYCFMFKRRILMLFSMMLVITSKETGVLMVGGFAAGLFIWRFVFCKKGILNRIKYALKEPFCTITALLGTGGAIVLLVFLQKGGKIWGFHSESKPEFSTITFIPEYVWNNIKQFYLLNFNWVTTVLIILCGVFAFIDWKNNKKLLPKIQEKETLAGVAGGYLLTLLFYFFYITFTLTRYHVIMDIIWTMFMIVLVGKFLCKYKSWCNVLLCFFCIIFVAEAYATIDPVSINSFMQHDTGNSIILTTQHKRKYLDTIFSGDYSVYNHQYTYIDKAVEIILKEVDYNGDMDIMSDSPWEIMLEGTYWDTVTKKLLYCASDNTILPFVFNVRDVYNTAQNRKAIFIYFPQSGSDLEELMYHASLYYQFYYGGEVEIECGSKLYYWVGERI